MGYEIPAARRARKCNPQNKIHYYNNKQPKRCNVSDIYFFLIIFFTPQTKLCSILSKMIDFSCIGSQLFSVIPPLVDRNFFNPPNPFPNLEYYWEPDNTYILICTNYCTCTMAPPGWPQVAAAPSFLPCLCFCLFFVFLFSQQQKM